MTLGVTRSQMHKYDCEKLMLEPVFRRWLFTELQSCGIFTGYFQPEVAFLAYGEGRRSVGLDILSDLAGQTGQTKEEVLSTIIAEESKTLKEVLPNGNRNSNRSDRNRADELTDGDDASG
jgi:hypothetical protein